MVWKAHLDGPVRYLTPILRYHLVGAWGTLCVFRGWILLNERQDPYNLYYLSNSNILFLSEVIRLILSFPHFRVSWNNILDVVAIRFLNFKLKLQVSQTLIGYTSWLTLDNFITYLRALYLQDLKVNFKVVIGELLLNNLIILKLLKYRDHNRQHFFLSHASWICLCIIPQST